jgi:hypothetical protein
MSNAFECLGLSGKQRVTLVPACAKFFRSPCCMRFAQDNEHTGVSRCLTPNTLVKCRQLVQLDAPFSQAKLRGVDTCYKHDASNIMVMFSRGEGDDEVVAKHVRVQRVRRVKTQTKRGTGFCVFPAHNRVHASRLDNTRTDQLQHTWRQPDLQQCSLKSLALKTRQNWGVQVSTPLGSSSQMFAACLPSGVKECAGQTCSPSSSSCNSADGRAPSGPA